MPRCSPSASGLSFLRAPWTAYVNSQHCISTSYSSLQQFSFDMSYIIYIYSYECVYISVSSSVGPSPRIDALPVLSGALPRRFVPSVKLLSKIDPIAPELHLLASAMHHAMHHAMALKRRFRSWKCSISCHESLKTNLKGLLPRLLTTLIAFLVGLQFLRKLQLSARLKSLFNPVKRCALAG